MNRAVYLSEEQKQSFEMAIRIKLAERSDSKAYPKIIYSRFCESSTYEVIFVDAQYDFTPLVEFDAKKLQICSMLDFAGSIVDCYLKLIKKAKTDSYTYFCMPKEKYSYLKNHLFIQAMNYDNNRELLRFIPHNRLFDMAEICRLDITDLISDVCKGFRSIIFDFPMLEQFDISMDQLFNIAAGGEWNQYKALPIISVEDKNILYCVRELKGAYGSSAMFSIPVLNSLSHHMNSDLIIIPKNIHELFVCAKTDDIIPILQSITNRLRLDIRHPDEFLSDQMYMFIRRHGEIEEYDFFSAK